MGDFHPLHASHTEHTRRERLPYQSCPGRKILGCGWERWMILAGRPVEAVGEESRAGFEGADAEVFIDFM